jgi:DNA polymerase IV
MIYQLQTIPKHSLQEWLGKWGEAIYAKSHGIGSRTLNNDRKRKSLGHQETFSTDTLKTSLLIKQLRQLTKKTVQGLRKEQLTCRTVEVVVRFADFETKTRSKSFPTQTDDYDTIWERALGLFVPFLDERQNPQKKLIRLIGISLGKIETLTKNS